MTKAQSELKAGAASTPAPSPNPGSEPAIRTGDTSDVGIGCYQVPDADKKTSAKITVSAKKMNKKQKAALLRKLKKAGTNKKAKVK